MPWPLVWIVDLFDAIAAWYYRRKYGAAARQLGRDPLETDERRGFIIIEIDGLAHDYLLKAVRQGYMPYLARLSTEQTLEISKWHCGLPSTTPASQAGIMYGNNWDIPGFRWYDKEEQSSINCKLPTQVRTIQERVSGERTGLIEGGSSYTNMFDGGARLALFTLSALGRHRVLENVRGLGFLILFLIGPVRIIRMIGLSLWTWTVYVAKRLAAFLRPGSRSPHFYFLGPLLEIFNNVIFREVTTFSVMIDIYRGMPAIYAAYTGYDEIAHHFGADCREALQALRGIDQQLRRIDRIRRLYLQREYDFFVLSDHGMSPSIPFSRAYGESLEQLIARHTGQPVQREDESEGMPEARAHFLVDELQALEARSHRQMPGRMLRATREGVEKRLLADLVQTGWDLDRRSDIVVRNSGSLSHVYFNVTRRALNLSEIAVLYPDLLQSLVEHEGIGVVAGRELESTLFMGQEGTLQVGPDGWRLTGVDPMRRFPDTKWAVGQVARVAHFPHAGDLVMLGSWDGDRVVSFEEQVASHGGLGGPQNWPFFAHPPGFWLARTRIEGAEELYKHLIRPPAGAE